MKRRSLPALLPALSRIVRHFWPYLRTERALIGGSFIALFADVAFRLLEPWPLKLVFDYVLVPTPERSATRTAVEGFGTPTVLALAAGAVVAIAGLRAVAAYGGTVGFALVGNRVLTNIRNELYLHIQRLSLRFHARASSGDLVVRVIGDVGQLKDVTVTALLPLVGNTCVLIGMIGVMLWMHWQLALFALAVVPLFSLSTQRFGRRIWEVAREQRRRDGAMAAGAAESIGGIKTVKALSLEPLFGRAFASHSARSLSEGVKAKRLEARLERSVDLLIALATAMVLWYGATLVRRGVLTAGDLLVFLAYFKNAFRPLRDFAKHTGRLAKGAAAGERILDLLELTPDVRDLPGARPAPDFRGALRFEGVSFAYEEGPPVLREVECAIAPGQHVAIVGPSGSGKSTLVSLVLRLHDPACGRVLIDGSDVREYTLASLRSQISVVLQDTILFAASVRDNIAYGALDALDVTDDQIRTAVVLANADEFVCRLPDGYETVLGERGVTLSAGQRQRLAVARAAIRQAPIIVLDEPMTGLDEHNRRALADALARLAHGRTTLLVTHELGLAVGCDQILFIEGGRIVERGTHRELMEANGRYAAMYQLQAAARDAQPEHHVVSR